MKYVVIVGGGFAGLNCAKKLAKHPDVRVTPIDNVTAILSINVPSTTGRGSYCSRSG